ncbi:MAG: hypothetical protein K1X28_08755 [Parachlamydiales bacterium]|nr:hypothetical protein [Parachlamydiales bacterium]
MLRRILLFSSLAGTLISGPFSWRTPAPKEEEKTKCCNPRAVLPTADPCNGYGNMYVSAALLFWQAKMWGLEFATKSFTPNTPGSTDQTFQEKLYVPDFAWKPGFRLIVGGHLPYDEWDARIGWTVYREECTSLKKHFDSVISPAGIGLIPLWHYPFVQTSGDNVGNPLRFGTAWGNWTMILNTFDLELGRSFFPDRSIPMRLKIGAKIAATKQKVQVEYANGSEVLGISPSSGLPSLFQTVSSKFHVRTHHWGMGPRVGLSSNWHMFYGISLIGNGAFSILYSQFNVESKYDDVIVPNPGSSKMKMEEHFHELTPICEAMLGLDWGMNFSNNFYLGIQLGYEWQYWWSINHARRNYVQTLPGETIDMRGDLQMQGLNGAVKFDF